MRVVAAVACEHKNELVKSDGELICPDCGVVIVDKETVQNQEMEVRANSKTTLYNRHKVGTRELVPKNKSTEGVRRFLKGGITNGKIARNDQLLSTLSKCCNKLGMSEAESEYVRKLYKRGSDYTKKKDSPYVAMWAIYKSSKRHSIPIPSTKIQRTVIEEWGRGHTIHMTHLLWKMMGVPLDFDETSDERYNFRLYLNKILKGKKFKKHDYAIMERNAWELYKNTYVIGTNPARAKRAISDAFRVRGV